MPKTLPPRIRVTVTALQMREPLKWGPTELLRKRKEIYHYPFRNARRKTWFLQLNKGTGWPLIGWGATVKYIGLFRQGINLPLYPITFWVRGRGGAECYWRVHLTCNAIANPTFTSPKGPQL